MSDYRREIDVFNSMVEVNRHIIKYTMLNESEDR